MSKITKTDEKALAERVHKLLSKAWSEQSPEQLESHYTFLLKSYIWRLMQLRARRSHQLETLKQLWHLERQLERLERLVLAEPEERLDLEKWRDLKHWRDLEDWLKFDERGAPVRLFISKERLELQLQLRVLERLERLVLALPVSVGRLKRLELQLPDSVGPQKMEAMSELSISAEPQYAIIPILPKWKFEAKSIHTRSLIALLGIAMSALPISYVAISLTKGVIALSPVLPIVFFAGVIALSLAINWESIP